MLDTMEDLRRRRAIVLSTFWVMAGTILSNLFGLLRESLLARFFGASGATDSFVIAFSFPAAISLIFIGGAIQGAFIPVYTEVMARRGEETAFQVASSFINGLTFVLLVLTFLFILSCPWIVKVIAPGFSADYKKLTIQLMRIILPFIFFASLSWSLVGLLHSYKHFFAPAFAPVLMNLVVILSMIMFTSSVGIFSVALGVILGSICQFLFLLLFVRGRGIRYFPRLFHNTDSFRIWKLMTPIMIWIGLEQVAGFVQKAVASHLEIGSVAILNFAAKIESIPLGIFAMAISVVLFPTLSSHAAGENLAKIKEDLFFGFRSIALLLLPSSVMLIIFASPLVKVLFQHGAFESRDALETAKTLVFYSLGIFSQGMILYLVRVYYSIQDMKTPLKFGAMCVGLQVILCFLFAPLLGVKGLALATSIYATVLMCVLLVGLSHRLSLMPRELKGAGYDFVKFAFCALAMAGAGLLIFKNTGEVGKGWIRDIISLGVSISSGLLLYVILLKLIGVKELSMIWRILRGR